MSEEQTVVELVRQLQRQLCERLEAIGREQAAIQRQRREGFEREEQLLDERARITRELGAIEHRQVEQVDQAGQV
jgi:hypothetical protein